MSFKPGEVVAALTKVVPDVGDTMLTALKTELLAKGMLTLVEAVACLTRCGVSPAQVLDVRKELGDPSPAADTVAQVSCLLARARVLC